MSATGPWQGYLIFMDPVPVHECVDTQADTNISPSAKGGRFGYLSNFHSAYFLGNLKRLMSERVIAVNKIRFPRNSVVP